MTTTLHRILIVDDNPGDVELVRIACEMAGLNAQHEQTHFR